MAMQFTQEKKHGRRWILFLLTSLVLLMTQVFCMENLLRVTADREWGYLTSVGYPFRYRSNTNDIFMVQALYDTDVIDIIAEVMQLESQPIHCPRDYLEFYDGSDINSTFIKRLCIADGRCFSSSNTTMLIIFKSDALREGKGFKIKYRSVKTSESCKTSPFQFKWIGQLIGVVISIILVCAFWEFFKKKHSRGVFRDKLCDRCSKLSACCTNYASDNRNHLARLIRPLVSRFRRTQQEPVRVTPEVSTLPTNGAIPDRNTLYGVGTFENEAFDDSELSFTPPPYPREFTADPPPYEACVIRDQSNVEPPSYSQTQISELESDVTTQITYISPPPSYDHVISNPSNYEFNS